MVFRVPQLILVNIIFRYIELKDKKNRTFIYVLLDVNEGPICFCML